MTTTLHPKADFDADYLEDKGILPRRGGPDHVPVSAEEERAIDRAVGIDRPDHFYDIRDD